jgi:hypothetical protein
MDDAWRNAFYTFGGAAGWWFAFYLESSRSRWLTMVVAIVYTIPFALRMVVAVLGGWHG